jgi:hypothetical protein
VPILPVAPSLRRLVLDQIGEKPSEAARQEDHRAHREHQQKVILIDAWRQVPGKRKGGTTSRYPRSEIRADAQVMGNAAPATAPPSSAATKTARWASSGDVGLTVAHRIPRMVSHAKNELMMTSTASVIPAGDYRATMLNLRA